MMDTQHKTMVKQSWTQINHDAARLGELFYTRLFAMDPALRPLFKGDLQQQGENLVRMMDHAVAGLDQLDAILPVIRELGRRHAGFGVRDKDYATFGDALIWTFQTVLGPDFTPEVEEAWRALYALMSNTMREAASDTE